ncbi:ATP-binding protein [Streptomyces sp. DSM 110735]|uniref:ATP-binding protein n=1 Tax=Streptomyces sp. DSM 110735 TaxID=2775031 RepID=UPI0018F49B5A|nr:ATP-binding protein [Streptomyces sp. DSM 110735]MBJ7905128.1 ATP-binding protein [Streptomyces sp. DSM 110735]
MPQPTTRARPTGHPGYSETLPRDPKSAATARRLVRVAVSDFSHVLPELCTPKDDEEGGRGLALVTGLATKWGTEKKPWGKIVWAELEGRR